MLSEEVIISDSLFDVPADNYEEFDQEINPALLGNKLAQSNPLKGSIRQYQFYGSHYLLLNFIDKKNAIRKKYHVNLAWLSAEPEHHKLIVWKWLNAALAAATVFGVCLYLGLTQTMKPEYCIIGGTLSLTAALVSALIFIYQLRDEYIFKSCFGDARLLLIENRKPDQASFDAFFIELQQRIDRAQANIPVASRLVGELKMCRRLRDEGIIDDEIYTLARTAIFKHKQYKS